MPVQSEQALGDKSKPFPAAGANLAADVAASVIPRYPWNHVGMS